MVHKRKRLFQIMLEEMRKLPNSPFDGANTDHVTRKEATLSAQAVHDYLASLGDFNLRVL